MTDRRTDIVPLHTLHVMRAVSITSCCSNGGHRSHHRRCCQVAPVTCTLPDTWLLGSTRVCPGQTASRSVQPFCRAHSRDQHTGRQTDRQAMERQDMRGNDQHLASSLRAAMSATNRIKQVCSASYVSCKRGTARICCCVPCCGPLMMQNFLLFIQPRWQPRIYFYNNYNVLFLMNLHSPPKSNTNST